MVLMSNASLYITENFTPRTSYTICDYLHYLLTITILYPILSHVVIKGFRMIDSMLPNNSYLKKERI